MKPILRTFSATLLIGLLMPGGVRADFLTGEKPSIPGVKVAPETGRTISNPARNGASYLKEQYEEPKVVRLRFCTEFTGSTGLQATILNCTVSGEPDEYRLGTTDTGEVLVVPYKTYQLSLSGELVCWAETSLVVPPVYNLLSGKNGTGDPARRYAVLFWDSANNKWQKVCTSYKPTWSDQYGRDSDLETSFLIQVRPDLGSRPVVYPGQGQPAGDDQADDGWTRDEPAINATTVIGDGDPVSFAGGTDPDPAVTTLRWAVNLGRMWNGTSAGRIRMVLNRLDTNAYSPQGLLYTPRSLDPNEIQVIRDLDDTNCIAQIRVPHGLATADPLYGSALFTNTDFISTYLLVQQLTNHIDLLSGYLWTNFSASAQQTLTNVNSTLQQLQSTLTDQLNQRIQAGAIYDANRFSGISLSGRTRRLLLLNPSGNTLVRLNRFLLEDAYASKIARLGSMSFEMNFFVISQFGGVDSLGFFTNLPNATSFVTWRVSSPDGSTNQWAMQEVRNGVTNCTALAYSSGSHTWYLTNGIWPELRIESRAVAVTVTSGVTNRLESQQVSNGSGVVSEKNSEMYQGFPWGYELVALTNDPGGANLATIFSYCSDTNSAAYGQVTNIVYPDRYWETRAYSDVDWDTAHPYGSLISVVHPWKDTPPETATNDCLVTDYDYHCAAPVIQGLGTYELQTWHDAARWGEENSSQKYKSLVRAEATVIALDDCSDSEVVTEAKDLGSIYLEGEMVGSGTFGPTAGRRAGQLHHKSANPAKLDSYDYEFGSWDSSARVFSPSGNPATDGQDLRQTIYHGVNTVSPPPGAYECLSVGLSGQNIERVNLVPFLTTKEVRILQNGNLAAKETYIYEGNSTYDLIEQTIYQRDCLGHATNTFRVDGNTYAQRVIYQADWKGAAAWPTDLKLSETDEHGQVTMYAYNALKRLVTSTKLGASVSGYPVQAAITNCIAYDASGRTLTNTTSAGSLSLKVTSLYDLSGRVVTNISPEALVTRYSYTNGGQQVTTTFSSGTTKIVENYLDRRLKSVIGTAVTNSFLDYGQTGWFAQGSQFRLLPVNVTTNTFGSLSSARWTAEVTDPRNEGVEWIQRGFGTTSQIWRILDFVGAPAPLPNGVFETGFEDPPGDPGDGWYTAYRYDYFGHKWEECRDGPDLLAWQRNLATLSRVTIYTNFYQLDDQGHWCNVSEEWACQKDNDSTLTFVSRSKERLTGFATNEISETQSFDADTNQTTVKVTIDLANKKLTTTTTAAQSSLVATQVVVNGLPQTESTPTVASPTCHYYDALGREIGTKDPLGNLSGTQYDPATGQAMATTNAQGLVTTMQYYPGGGTNAGLLKCQTGATGRKTYYNYDGSGRVIQTWGDVPYPEQRTYNQFGDLDTLTTYRGGSGWTGSSWPSTTGTGDVTHWYYDEPTGLLTNKTDAAGRYVTWDYYLNHYPKTRIWARGAASTNVYTVNGDLARIDYSDGSSVLFTNETYPNYNRSGHPVVVIDGSGTNVLAYDYAERLVSSACTGGLLSGITVTNHFDGVHGRDLLKVTGISPVLTTSYGYDGYGRLSNVSSGNYSAAYAYWPNSDLLQTTTCKNNTTPVLTTIRTWETGPRLRQISSTINNQPSPISSFTYRYDSLDRRIQAGLEDGSVWNYDYNDRNELISARRYWSDWAPVSGQQYAYDYDNIGNRKSASSGGDTSGCNLRPTTYAVNSLNQYSSVTNAGYEDIIGAAFATNTVGITNSLTGTGGLADREGEYFHREISINNSAPLWQTVSVGSGGSISNGGFAFPANNQTLTYDLDGNLTSDGIWAYEWDSENRLAAMSMASINSLWPTNRLRLEFVYDYQGRRISKTVKAWSGSDFTNRVTTRFVYDGWNLVATLNAQQSTLNSFMWGQDISGTEDGAGGIGGLVGVFEISGGQISNCHFAAYDANGNVTALVRASDFASSRYEYSPYGETLRATGPLASANPIRFSTRFADNESGLLCYPRRMYSPIVGCWMSRDPINEEGGDNLYAFVFNEPLTSYDAMGTFTLVEQEVVAGTEGDMMAQAINAGRQMWSFYKKVKDTIDAFNSAQQMISEIEEIHKAIDDGNPDEILLGGLQLLGEAFGNKLRGPRSFGKWAALGEDHHIATDKSIKTGWTRTFAAIFKRCGKSLQDDKNIIPGLLGHKGRHANKYHQLVKDTIKDCKTGKELVAALRKLRAMIVSDPSITRGNGL